MRFILVVGLAVTWAACGSSKPGEGGAIGNAAPDAGPRQIPPLAAGCPATMAEATGTCVWEQSPSNCQWAEGQCYCGYPRVCSGAAVNEEDVPAEPPAWMCEGWPPAVREDGCPGERSSGRCTEEGKQCVYGDCCVATYTCTKGEWQETAHECPP